MANEFPDIYFGEKRPDSLPTQEDIAHARRSFKRNVISFIESLPQNAHVLDVGCGAGKTMKMVKVLRPDVKITGMDFTDMRPFLPEDMEFVQGNVDALTELYPEATFDAVICQHVVEHLLYPVPIMNGIRFVLKPGGRAFIETPNWTRLLLPFSHLWFWSDYTHVRPSSKYAMHRLLSEHAFQVETLVTTSSCMWFPKKARTSGEVKKTTQSQSFRHGLLSRAFARILNPLMRDVVIGIGRKP